jgi:hypothetical protein
MARKRSRVVDFVVTEVPHRSQRYDTVGDWIPGKPTEIRVSRMRDKRYVFLVALHELIEYELCMMNGISDWKAVKFDRTFEMERNAGLHDDTAEPGDDPRAPYREEHAFATLIEKTVARKLGVDWVHYERTVASLGRRRRVAMKQVAVRNR